MTLLRVNLEKLNEAVLRLQIVNREIQGRMYVTKGDEGTKLYCEGDIDRDVVLSNPDFLNVIRANFRGASTGEHGTSS